MAEVGEHNRNGRRVAPVIVACLALIIGGVVFTATSMAQTDFDPSSYLAKNYQSYASEQLQSTFDVSQRESDAEANRNDADSSNGEDSVDQVEISGESDSSAYSITGGDAATTIITAGEGAGTASSPTTVNGPVVDTGTTGSNAGNGDGGSGGNSDSGNSNPTPAQPTYTDTYGDLDDDSTAHYDSQGNEVLGITVSGAIPTMMLGQDTDDTDFWNSNVVVTAQKRNASGEEFSETLFYGEYSVQANTARVGNFSALFEYYDTYASQTYEVESLYATVRVTGISGGGYYSINPNTSDDYPIGSAEASNKGAVYATSGTCSIDLRTALRQTLAWYDAGFPGETNEANRAALESNNIAAGEQGYLTTMTVGFSKKSISGGTDGPEAPYSLDIELDTGTATTVYLAIKEVPEGALMRLVSSDEDGAHMGDQVFVGCTSTSNGSFAVPYGTTKIALDQDCSGLTSLAIPGSVISIDAASLGKYAISLTSFSVDDDNANFSSENGLLMDKAGTTVLAVPAGIETVELPAGTTLSADALSGRTGNLTLTLTDAEPSDALLQSILDAAAQMSDGAALTIAVPDSTDNVSYVHYLAAWGKSLADKGITLTVNGNETVAGLYALRDDGSVVSSKDAGYLACVPWDAETYEATGITSIGSGALGTGSLAALTLDAANPPSLESKIFGESYDGVLVLVPEYALSDYQQAWTTQLDGEYGEGTAESALGAESGLTYLDGAYYKTNSDGTLTLQKVTAQASTHFTVADGTTSIAANAFKGCAQIVTVSVPEDVASISTNAFTGCTNLELVCLPSTLTSLEANAFDGCTALRAIACNASSAPSTSLSLSASNVALYAPTGTVNAYSNWGSVTEAGASYLIADGILGAAGTSGATVLKAASTINGTFTAGAEVTTIADGAFEGCTALTGIDLSACTEFASIGTGAFQGCTALESVTLGGALTVIPDDCFNGCTALTSISAPSSLKAIGNRAFKQCTSLPDLGFLQDTALTTIGDEAFCECTVLRYGSSNATYLPSTVSSIGASAFEGCASVKDVVLPASLTTLREKTFANCSSLQTVKLTAPIYSIGKYCFENCAVLNTVALRTTTATSVTAYAAEGSLVIIGVGAFENCSALSSMNLSGAKKLAAVGARAFEDCSTLSSIRFASGITELQDECFAGCSSLVDINLPTATAPSIGTAIFGEGSLDTENTTVYVNESARSSFLSAWTSTLDGEYGEGTTEELLQASADGSFTLSGVTYEMNDDDTYTLVKASTSLTGEYVIMAGTTYIADKAFVGCNGITSISFPADDTSTTVTFGNECFKGCTGLTEVTLNCNVPSMGYSVFEDCTNLADLTVPYGYTIKRLGTRCFANCTSMGTASGNYYVATFQGVIETYGEECFAGCTKLTHFSTSTSFKAGLTTVEDRAFMGCTALKVPWNNTFTGLTSLGKEVFKGCTSLSNVTVPASFSGTLPEGTYEGCTGMKYCSIYGAVDTIGENCFKGCTSLRRTGGTSTFYNALTTIEESAYEGCTNLATPDTNGWSLSYYPNLSYIGDRAFYGCSANFTEAVFANASMSYIGTDAFAGCSSLASMSFAGTTLPTIKNLNLSDYASGFTITSSAYSDDENAAEANAAIYDSYLDTLTDLVGAEEAEAILAKPSTMNSSSPEDDASGASIASIVSVEDEGTVSESEDSRTGEATEQGSTNNAAAGTEGSTGDGPDASASSGTDSDEAAEDAGDSGNGTTGSSDSGSSAGDDTTNSTSDGAASTSTTSEGNGTTQQ